MVRDIFYHPERYELVIGRIENSAIEMLTGNDVMDTPVAITPFNNPYLTEMRKRRLHIQSEY
jgi:hypothetical protein